MRAYTYKPEEVGLKEWPQGTLRLEGMEATENPQEADLFICPGPLMLFRDPSDLKRFPYFKEHEERSVWFDCSDYETVYDTKAILIRCNLRTWMLARDVNSVSFAWPVDCHEECMPVPEGGFRYDVSFQGWLWSDVRKASVSSVSDTHSLRFDVACYSDFTGYIWNTAEGKRRRWEFRRSMRESRLALCPESIPGVFPYRFFEAMSAGRVPVLVGSDYVLPFSDEIPWDSFTLRIPRQNASGTGNAIVQFLREHSDEELIRMGKLARLYWRQFLHRDDWPKTMAYAVRKQLNVGAAA